MDDVRFGSYTIRRNPKPIPTTAFDWDFWHDDFDGAPDANDNRCGAAASVEACKAEICEIEEGRDDICDQCGVDETCCRTRKD